MIAFQTGSVFQKRDFVLCGQRKSLGTDIHSPLNGLRPADSVQITLHVAGYGPGNHLGKTWVGHEADGQNLLSHGISMGELPLDM
ncbi:hypothetical protein GCM10025781_17530 [Kocuria gwangalliensis]|uniref:Uncharacterized protein n=1 Tax=Kocuria gwangalliensis TaxID=501592 RepID=A0ABP8X303_9MICC